MKLEYKDYPLTYNGCLLEYNSINGEEPDYSKSYLTFEALENGTISFNIWLSMGTDMITSISYSKDDGKTWITTNNINDKSEHLQINVDVEEGDKILWKGNATLTGFYNEDDYGDAVGSFFSSDCLYNAYGNIMSLLYEDNFYNKTDLNNITYIFSYLFCDYDEELSNLIKSAKNLILPATILTENCYFSMFAGCSDLITAPKLPATTLARYCYESMFTNCSSLITAPKLSATTLVNGCYCEMFSHCSSLTIVPELPATTLADDCYSNMFYDCTSLTMAPALPATTLATYCYSGMFQGCTSLTTAPELPVTTLARYCYQAMFNSCTSLTTAPSLPATILADCCYDGMFSDCTSLTTAPELSATTLGTQCYRRMFLNCNNLNNITMLAENISASECLDDWVDGVAATGTFTKSANMVTLPTGNSGIPSGWTVKNV